MARWVVLRRGQISQLKCLQCGWKWRSKCKYVAKLPDHVERSRVGMSDQDILNRLKAGTLKIEPETAQVWSYSELWGWKLLKPQKNQHNDGYRFVDVCYAGKKKRIAVHRLQWMQHTLKLIPEGYDVHHKEAPPWPEAKDNSLGNLELMESLENQLPGVSPGMSSEAPF